jgi:hypothetical protein
MVQYDTQFSSETDSWAITADGRELGSVKLKSEADTFVEQLRSRQVRAVGPIPTGRAFREPVDRGNGF